MTQPFTPGDDRRPRGIQSDSPRRRWVVLTIAAVVLISVGALITALGVPWWIPAIFVVTVFLLILFST